jgi:hypothetical protein
MNTQDTKAIEHPLVEEGCLISRPPHNVILLNGHSVRRSSSEEDYRTGIELDWWEQSRMEPWTYSLSEIVINALNAIIVLEENSWYYPRMEINVRATCPSGITRLAVEHQLGNALANVDLGDHIYPEGLYIEASPSFVYKVFLGS